MKAKKQTSTETQNMTSTEKENEIVMKNNDLIKNIVENYIFEENLFANQFKIIHKHGPTIGTFREEIWKDMFLKIVPKKFSIERSVFLIDSNGNVSSEVDLAIFDEMYTPYIFKRGQIKYIPIEAVAVAIQCKSSSFDNVSEWAGSIKNLNTCSESIARTAYKVCTESVSTQSATRPILILCSIKKPTDKVKDDFDFVISINCNSKNDICDMSIDVDTNLDDNLNDWYIKLNHANKCNGENNTHTKSNKEPVEHYLENNTEEEKYKLTKCNMGNYVVKKNNINVSLMTLNFQLNQLLMLINNPMLFPHQAYVKLFNDIKW